MADQIEEATTGGEGGGQPQTPAPDTAAGGQVSGGNPTDLLQILAQQVQQQGEALQRLLAEKAQPAPQPPAPEPVQKPEPPQRQTPEAVREYLQNLETFAETQAQEAARYKVAKEFGIEPDELDSDYRTPADMRSHAKQVAEIKRVSQLAQDLETKLAQVQNGVPQTPPNASTSGTSGIEAGAPSGLEQEYQNAIEIGRKNSEQGVMAYLMTVYKDPSKRVR